MIIQSSLFYLYVHISSWVANKNATCILLMLALKNMYMIRWEKIVVYFSASLDRSHYLVYSELSQKTIPKSAFFSLPNAGCLIK